MDSLSKQLNDIISDIDSRVNNVVIMDIISGEIAAFIDQNFDAGGRWDGDINNITFFSGGDIAWYPLGESTQKQYERKGIEDLTATLEREGFLRNSIEVYPIGPNLIEITANQVYAAVHQFGSRPDSKQNIPPRPYLVIHPDNIKRIIDILAEFVWTPA